MFTFIVLHYKNVEDTIKCINSIRNNINGNVYKIVIVVNSKESHDTIRIFKSIADDVIESLENLGFAKGNNFGCSYAIKKYYPDFLVVINSDVIIEQKSFLKIIKSTYEEYDFDVLGPYIKSPTNESFNPFPVYKTVEEVDQALIKSKKLIMIYSNMFLSILLAVYVKIKKGLKNFFKLTKIAENGKSLEKNVALHGCALIFSKKYYQKYNDVFYKDTFLYHEEEFLYQRMLKDNLVFLYNPELKIIHNEGSSLNKEYKKERVKKLFRNKEIVNSLEKLKKIM